LLKILSAWFVLDFNNNKNKNLRVFYAVLQVRRKWMQRFEMTKTKLKDERRLAKKLRQVDARNAAYAKRRQRRTHHRLRIWVCIARFLVLFAQIRKSKWKRMWLQTLLRARMVAFFHRCPKKPKRLKPSVKMQVVVNAEIDDCNVIPFDFDLAWLYLFALRHYTLVIQTFFNQLMLTQPMYINHIQNSVTIVCASLVTIVNKEKNNTCEVFCDHLECGERTMAKQFKHLRVFLQKKAKDYASISF
jgi:hypothetical protein